MRCHFKLWHNQTKVCCRFCVNNIKNGKFDKYRSWEINKKFSYVSFSFVVSFKDKIVKT